MQPQQEMYIFMRNLCHSLLIGLVLTTSSFAAQDDDRWFATPPEVRQWFRNLTQPDNGNSCCGEADAYWSDSYKTKGDQYIAIITDTRDDVPLGRPHVAPGTEILVPNNKLKFDAGNPTGHGVIFIKWNDETDSYSVLCYVTPGGG